MASNNKIDTFLSTVTSMKEFRNSLVWKDMRLYLEEQLAFRRNLLETEVEILNIRFLQGEIDVLKGKLSLPDVLIEQMEAEAVLTKEKEEVEEDDT